MMKHPLSPVTANVSRLFGLATVVLLVAASLLGKGYYPPRISFIDGKASFEPAGDVDWSEVTVNLPILSGDRIISQPDSRVEVELGQGNFLRLGGNTDVVFGNVSGRDGDIEMKLGELVLRVNDSARYFVHLPNASVKIKKKGYYRFSVNEQGDSRLVVWKGRAEVENAVGERRVEDGKQLIIAGTNATLENVSFAPDRDDLDFWSDRRDAHFASSQSVAKVGGTSYVGVYDLDHHGAWDYVPSYGNVWFPRVSVGWAPYRMGRWSHYPTWGWTWVSYEPWGWLPYHHGRWHYYQPYNRWGWAPGSFSYWSPARVHFYWGSGYVGWSPYGFGFGFGSRGGYYGGGGYINNSVTIVSNKTIINNYQDPASGLTVVTEDDFRSSRVDRSRVKSIDRTLVGNLKAGLPRSLAAGPSRSRPRNTVVAGKGRGVGSTRAQRGVTGSFSKARTSSLAGRSAASSKARSGTSSVTRAPLGARQVTSTGTGNSRSRVATSSSRTRAAAREISSSTPSRRTGSAFASSSSRSRTSRPRVTTIPRSNVGSLFSKSGGSSGRNSTVGSRFRSTTTSRSSVTGRSSSRGSSVSRSSRAVRTSGTPTSSSVRPSRPSSSSRSRSSVSRSNSRSGVSRSSSSSRPSSSRSAPTSTRRPR